MVLAWRTNYSERFVRPFQCPRLDRNLENRAAAFLPRLLLLAATFAFAPVVFINSVAAKDYVWAIAFVLLAFWAALAERPIVSGLLLGLAVGCRITSGAMLIPLALVLGHEKSRAFRWREAGWLTLTTLLASAICFFPVWSRYGLALFTFYENHTQPDLATIAARATIEPWGALGLISLTSGAIAACFCFLRGKEMDVSLCKPANSMILPALWLTIFPLRDRLRDFA